MSATRADVVRAIAEWIREGEDLSALRGDARDRLDAKICGLLADAVMEKFSWVGRGVTGQVFTLEEAKDKAFSAYEAGYRNGVKDSFLAASQREVEETESVDDELAPLRERMAKGRSKYANGCTILSLLDEAGEVAHSINKYESEERVREELLDVASVAMRLYLGEIDKGLEIDGLVQRRTDQVAPEAVVPRCRVCLGTGNIWAGPPGNKYRADCYECRCQGWSK